MKKKSDILKKYTKEQIMEAAKQVLSDRLKDVEKSIEETNKKFVKVIKQHEKELKKKFK